jgi:multidrug efflux pump subunit AcrB
VQFRVVGAKLDDVRRAADAVLQTLRSTPGTRDAQLAWGERAPSVRLVLDQARVRQMGLAPADIGQTLATLVDGATVTQLRDRTKLINVVLRAVPAERLDLDRLADLIVPTANGPLPLGQIAHIVPQTEEPILWRRDRESYLTAQAEIQDGLQAPDVTAAALPAIRALTLPAGVRVEVGGAAEESAKANTALAKIFPLMGLAMLMVLMVQLQNLPRTLLVLATMPLGIIGAVAALLLADAPFGFVALLGIIALGGMIMRNTVILVDQVRQDQAAGRNLRDAIIESTVRRARPVVLTALAAALAFVPLSFNVFWGPMALAMIGGLVVATGLTLGFLPALYAWAFRVKVVPTEQGSGAAATSRIVAFGG